MAYTDIDKPSDYFNTNLWTGNGTTATGITGVGFQPDMTWIKERSQIRSHVLFDVIRGATVQLNTNDTAVDATVAESLQSFDSDGFTVGNATSVNQSGETYVGWNWLASNTTASNTDGSITSTVSANTTSGFSVVSYTGTGSNATVGHGLSSAPKMIIVKCRNVAKDWTVYHSTLGNTKWIELNATTASQTSSNRWNNTSPTSSVFTVGVDSSVNGSGNTYIAYCFSDIKGYSKFGNYVGSGTQANDYGNQIYCGFRPSMIMVKQVDASRDWLIYDTSRLGYNDRNDLLFPNKSDSEFATDRMMLLSNGFAPRNDSAELNADGGTYIYMAFAENPFVTSTGIPTTAR